MVIDRIIEQAIAQKRSPIAESFISRYLKAGVTIKGDYEKTEKGTAQGGNLSPLLSNIMLNEQDKELEARKLRFVKVC